MEHHPVFSRFRQFSGVVPAGYHIDFVGSQISHKFIAGQGFASYPECRTVENYSYPMFDEEYFEWIDLLESVVAASKNYTMIELGSGYGRWVVRAALAAQQYDPKLSCTLGRCRGGANRVWMDEGTFPAQRPEAPSSLPAARRGDESGRARSNFILVGRLAARMTLAPDAWYGQSLSKDYEVAESKSAGKYKGFKVLRYKSGWRSIRIPGVSLKSILKKFDRVDLIDLDIEGEELPSLTAVAAELDAKVKRLHIGTHGKEIEAGLRALLTAHGWECRIDYSLFSTYDTPFGKIPV